MTKLDFFAFMVNKQTNDNFFYKSSAFWSFFPEIMLESFGCGLYTSATYTRVFTVYNYLLYHLIIQCKSFICTTENAYRQFGAGTVYSRMILILPIHFYSNPTFKNLSLNFSLTRFLCGGGLKMKILA